MITLVARQVTKLSGGIGREIPSALGVTDVLRVSPVGLTKHQQVTWCPPLNAAVCSAGDWTCNERGATTSAVPVIRKFVVTDAKELRQQDLEDGWGFAGESRPYLPDPCGFVWIPSANKCLLMTGWHDKNTWDKTVTVLGTNVATGRYAPHWWNPSTPTSYLAAGSGWEYPVPWPAPPMGYGGDSAGGVFFAYWANANKIVRYNTQAYPGWTVLDLAANTWQFWTYNIGVPNATHTWSLSGVPGLASNTIGPLRRAQHVIRGDFLYCISYMDKVLVNGEPWPGYSVAYTTDAVSKFDNRCYRPFLMELNLLTRQAKRLAWMPQPSGWHMDRNSDGFGGNQMESFLVHDTHADVLVHHNSGSMGGPTYGIYIWNFATNAGEWIPITGPVEGYTVRANCAWYDPTQQCVVFAGTSGTNDPISWAFRYGEPGPPVIVNIPITFDIAVSGQSVPTATVEAGYRVRWRLQGSGTDAGTKAVLPPTTDPVLGDPAGTVVQFVKPATPETYEAFGERLDSAGVVIGSAVGPVLFTVGGSPPPVPSTKFTLNQSVQVPSPTAATVCETAGGVVRGTQPVGARGVVTAGPTFAVNVWWWEINFDTGFDGWVRESTLAAVTAPPPTSTKFFIGQPVQVNVATSNVRSSPGGAILAPRAQGDLGVVIGGPTLAKIDGVGIDYWWWNIDFNVDPNGWAAEVNLVAGPASTAFASGDRVQVTYTGAVLRQTPGGASLGTRTLGDLGTVTASAPQQAQIGGTGTYYWWWNIDFDVDPNGWLNELYLAKAGLPPRFTVGEQVQVNVPTVNVAATAGGASIGTQVSGALGTILGGPTVVTEVTYWNVDFAIDPNGWVVESALTDVIVTPPTAFVGINGDRIRATVVATVRQTPGGTVLGTVPAATIGTVADGPSGTPASYLVNFRGSGARDGWVEATQIVSG
jgi:hypothetical protein